jgi:putative acetyltransferase
MSPTVLRLKNGLQVRVRPATNGDGHAVKHLVYSVLQEYDMQGEPDGEDSCLTDIEGNYTSAGGMFEVVEGDGHGLVGCYGLLPESGEVCELRKMYLSRAVRGQGLGRQLLSRALAEARILGFRRVELTTAAPLKEALALYKSFGFVDCERPGIPARCNRAMALELR